MGSPQASDRYPYASRDIGELPIAAAGERELMLRSVREIGRDVMYFMSLGLERMP